MNLENAVKERIELKHEYDQVYVELKSVQSELDRTNLTLKLLRDTKAKRNFEL